MFQSYRTEPTFLSVPPTLLVDSHRGGGGWGCGPVCSLNSNHNPKMASVANAGFYKVELEGPLEGVFGCGGGPVHSSMNPEDGPDQRFQENVPAAVQIPLRL